MFISQFLSSAHPLYFFLVTAWLCRNCRNDERLGLKLILITVIWLGASSPRLFSLFCLYLWHGGGNGALANLKRKADSRIKLQLCIIIRANFPQRFTSEQWRSEWSAGGGGFTDTPGGYDRVHVANGRLSSEVQGPKSSVSLLLCVLTVQCCSDIRTKVTWLHHHNQLRCTRQTEAASNMDVLLQNKKFLRAQIIYFQSVCKHAIHLNN